MIMSSKMTRHGEPAERHKLPTQKVIGLIQAAVESCVHDVKACAYPKLGPEYNRLQGADLQNALIAHRICKRFERPNAAGSNLRRERSVTCFLDTNASLDPLFDYRLLDRDGRRAFLRSREWLGEVLKGFRPTYRFAFPSGESVVSTGGETDMFDKLVREDQWTVSIDAIPYAAAIAYNTLQIKRVVRQRFSQKWKHQSKRWMQTWYLEAVAAGQKPGFYCFTRMFASLCCISGVSRVTTVPKTNEVDRVITCEPTWNMVAQLSLALDLRERLRTATGIDISYWQNVHRALIRNPGCATIDFSDASNRNRWSVVQALFPQGVVKHLARLRCTAFEYKDEYHPSVMFAPMGAGFTFDVMTLTLLAYARTFDPQATCFGDDVILKKECADGFMTFTENLGWVVNRSKSFSDGNFRESCGAFADLANDRLLVSYDIEWPVTMEDCFILRNKFVALARAATGFLQYRLERLCLDLLELIPRVAIVDESKFEVGLSDHITTAPAWWISLNPVEYPANTLLSVWSSMWQRKIELVQRRQERPAGVPAVKPQHSAIRLACYMRKGGVSPLTARREGVIKKVDWWSGVPVTGIPLVSVV